MGLRFRKSVKICKGVKVNFNTNSVGLSIGGKGYGYSINSNGRSSAHVGIPGTGLSYRKTFNNKSHNRNSGRRSSSSDVSIIKRVEMNDEGDILFFDGRGHEITNQTLINKYKRTPKFKQEKERLLNQRNNEIAKDVEKYNDQINEMININKLSAATIYSESDYEKELKNLKVKKYKKAVFNKPEPSKEMVKEELMEEAKEKIKGFAFLGVKSKWNEYVDENLDSRYEKYLNEYNSEKEVFEKNEQAKELELNEEYEEEYNDHKLYLENIISGSKDYIDDEIDEWLGDLEIPLEFNVCYDYEEKKNILWIDLDLPEIEDFPNQKAVQMANGSMKLKDKTKKELNEDYKNYVFGLAIFLSSHLFNISPKINYINISAYTQRRNNNGDIKDVYIYSIIFDRVNIGKYDLINENPYEVCMEFKNRCNITSTNMLKEIEPFVS